MADPEASRAERVEALDLRDLAPYVRFGTASDRYAGWIGQIYPEEYEDKVQTRTRRLGGDRYEERRVPVDSVRHYFGHFDVLEVDFTFYRPLLEPGGDAGQNWFVLQRYADASPDDAEFLLKAPQTYFARILRTGRGRYESNPDYLDADGCRRRFLEPARELLGDRLRGILFEQEYQRKKDAPAPEENVAELDGFFEAISPEAQIHIELRSPHLLQGPYFDWLADRGLGHVFSHWTWLPPIREQWHACGERFTAANGDAVARLLTPLRMKYADAYALAHPFDRPVAEIAESEQAKNMVMDATALAMQASIQDACVIVVANNRAWGNAPALAQTIARRVLEAESRQGS